MKYKDILNTFWWDTSYADRAQAALLKWDTAWFSNIAKEYKASQQPTETPTPTWPTPTNTYTPPTEWQYNPGNGNLGNWNYWADTADRQEQIVSNLNQAYAQSPDQFKDWSTFAQNFNYDYSGRSDKERETMRNWYSSTVWSQMDYNNAGNADYFFNQLMWWNPLQWVWAAADAAYARYQNYQYLSWLTPTQISDAVQSWKLNGVWQEMQDLKNYSPALYAQVQAALQGKTQLDDINAMWEWIYDWLTKTETNKNYTKYDMSGKSYAENASIINQYNSSLYNKIVWLWWDTAAYVDIVASLLQNPNIQASKNEVEELEWEIRKIQENMYTIWDSARTALGSEAPEDLVSAYISHQTKQLQNQLRTAQNSLLVAQGKLDNQVSEVEIMIDAINNGIKLSASWALGTGEVDNYDYQSSDPERLQQIQNNLDSIANSDEAYVFRDRNAFNDYFKYSQRSPAQQRVLDDYWNANSAAIQPRAQQAWTNYQKSLKTTGRRTWWSWGWGGGWLTEEWDVNKLKEAIINWTFTWSWTISNLKQYWYSDWADDETELKKIARTTNYADIMKMKENLAPKLWNFLEDERWDSHETMFIDYLKWIWDWDTKEERERLANYINQYSITPERERYYLQQAWIKEKNINKIMSL